MVVRVVGLVDFACVTVVDSGSVVVVGSAVEGVDVVSFADSSSWLSVVVSISGALTTSVSAGPGNSDATSCAPLSGGSGTTEPIVNNARNAGPHIRFLRQSGRMSVGGPIRSDLIRLSLEDTDDFEFVDGEGGGGDISLSPIAGSG